MRDAKYIFSNIYIFFVYLIIRSKRNNIKWISRFKICNENAVKDGDLKFSLPTHSVTPSPFYNKSHVIRA